MARGNGKQAQQAQSIGKLSAFVKPKDSNGQSQANVDFVDWSEISPSLLAGAIWAANKEGGALLFGHSRDKTCYSVKVYAGGDGTPYYFACTESGLSDLETFLQSIVDLVENG